MKFEWNQEKNKKLQKEKGLSFEAVIEAITNGDLLDEVQHPNKEKYPKQRIFIVKINNYACDIPYVLTAEKNYFLKTIFPNRKHHKKYLT